MVLYVQSTGLGPLMSALSHHKPLTNVLCSRSLKKLTPFINKGIICVGGRLENAAIDYEARHPAILPSNSHFTKLVVQHFHKLVGHSGVTHTYHAIQQKYWIEKASSTLRDVINQCRFACEEACHLEDR